MGNFNKVFHVSSVFTYSLSHIFQYQILSPLINWVLWAYNKCFDPNNNNDKWIPIDTTVPTDWNISVKEYDKIIVSWNWNWLAAENYCYPDNNQSLG